MAKKVIISKLIILLTLFSCIDKSNKIENSNEYDRFCEKLVSQIGKNPENDAYHSIKNGNMNALYYINYNIVIPGIDTRYYNWYIDNGKLKEIIGFGDDGLDGDCLQDKEDELIEYMKRYNTIIDMLRKKSL